MIREGECTGTVTRLSVVRCSRHASVGGWAPLSRPKPAAAPRQAALTHRIGDLRATPTAWGHGGRCQQQSPVVPRHRRSPWPHAGAPGRSAGPAEPSHGRLSARFAAPPRATPQNEDRGPAPPRCRARRGRARRVAQLPRPASPARVPAPRPDHVAARCADHVVARGAESCATVAPSTHRPWPATHSARAWRRPRPDGRPGAPPTATSRDHLRRWRTRPGPPRRRRAADAIRPRRPRDHQHACATGDDDVRRGDVRRQAR